MTAEDVNMCKAEQCKKLLSVIVTAMNDPSDGFKAFSHEMIWIALVYIMEVLDHIKARSLTLASLTAYIHSETL